MGPICSTFVHSQINLRYMCKIDSQSGQPFDHTFRSLLNCWSHKTTHNAALGYRGANCLSLCPFPDESTDVNQIWCQSVQPFDSFPRILNVGPPNPPRPDMPPVVLRGDLYLAYAHSKMNPQTWTKVGANRSSRLRASPDFWMFDPLIPPKCPLVSLRAICLAYMHSQMNLRMCTQFDANRTSRLTSCSDSCICDPLTPPPYLRKDIDMTNMRKIKVRCSNIC